MLDAYYSINGITSDKFEPKNAQELEVLATFDGNAVQPNITLSEVEFVQEGAVACNDYIDNGINGGYGIFEPLPFDITLKQYTDQYNAFNGLIDLADNYYREDQFIKVKIREKYGINTLEQNAQSNSFMFLESKGVFSASDYINVPYVRNDVPEYLQFAILSLTTFIFAKEIVESVKQTALGIKDSVQETAGGATGFIGAAIGIAIEIIIVTAYTTTMIIYLYKLIEQVIASVYSDVRYYKGIKVLTMMQKSCAYFGMTFKSSILEGAYANMVYLPIKTQKGNPNTSNIKFDKTGLPEKGYGYNLYEVYRLIMDMFNAKFLVKNGIVYFESMDNDVFWEQQSTYILPDIEVLNNGYNTDELVANFLLSMSTDDNDMNTLENFTGTNYEVITESISSPNIQQTSIKGFREVGLQVARGTRKTQLTLVEDLLKGLTSIADLLINIFGGGKTFADKINNRIGMLMLTSDSVSVPKLLICDNDGKISTQNALLINAKYLYLNYFKSSSLVSGKYQFKYYKNVVIPFGFTDFLKTIEFGWFKDKDANIGKFDKISCNFNNDFATVDYRIRYKYTNNLKETFIEA